MNKNARQDPKTAAIVIAILVIMWIAVSINIAFININRFLFWIDIIYSRSFVFCA